MACIPGGEFLRGSDKGPRDERPLAAVFLGPFFMDLREVTNGDYQACVKAPACRKAGPNYKGFSDRAQPITGVSWFDAEAFCRFRGKRLPSEAEWEKAARGTDGRRYPWGDAKATCAMAIIKEGEPNGCGRGKVWPVGSRPKAVHGLYDMAGNSWEWVADWYAPSYKACGAACEGRNPRGPCGGAAECAGATLRVVRGGSWYWDASYATTTKRRSHAPANRPFHHFGFRCAKDAAP
jgi:formylglycine-generating enzyme required for sulfatase activity